MIPFYSTPDNAICRNNKSALRNKFFVQEAIIDLEKRGLILRCSKIPYVVNSLTVAVQNNGKKRLILDLRLINKHVWKQCVKFEDINVALNFVFKECWMIKFDIHSAYHHINICNEHTEMLGFSWNFEGQIVYFNFLVLPFGLSSAVYIFTKVVRPLFKKWRSECKRVLMYLDDGFGCDSTRKKAIDMAHEIKQDLLLSGFVPKVEKCMWVPVQKLQFLGNIIDSKEGQLVIPKNRIIKALDTVSIIINEVNSRGKVQAKKLASFVGQIISMVLVVGNIALIMTKYLSFDIAKAKSWFSFIILSENRKDQLKFWRGNLNRLNLKRIFDQENCTKIIYSDASSSGFAGNEVSTINGLVHGMWSPDEKLKISTWREL